MKKWQKGGLIGFVAPLITFIILVMFPFPPNVSDIVIPIDVLFMFCIVSGVVGTIIGNYT